MWSTVAWPPTLPLTERGRTLMLPFFRCQFLPNTLAAHRAKFIFEDPCFSLPWHRTAQAKRSQLYFGNYAIQDSRNLGLGVPALKSNLLPALNGPHSTQCVQWRDAVHKHEHTYNPSPHTQQALVIMLGLTGIIAQLLLMFEKLPVSREHFPRVVIVWLAIKACRAVRSRASG